MNLNVEPHFLVRVMFRAQVLHRYGLCHVEKAKFQNNVEVMFRPIIRADGKYVERQYTIFITMCEKISMPSTSQIDAL